MMLDVPAQHGMQVQEEQLTLLEGSQSCCEQAQAHKILQVLGCLLFVVQDVGSELWTKGGLEEADCVEGGPLFGGEASDAVVHAGVEGSLAFGVLQAGGGCLFGNFKLCFALLQ